MCDAFPHLFSFTLNEDVSVAAMMNSTEPGRSFALPLSDEAYEEYEQVTEILAVAASHDNADCRNFVWGTASYTAAKYYKFIFSRVPQNRALDLVWASKCLPKLRVFLWLLIHDRLNTKDLMIRKHWNFDGGPHCVLCSQSMLESTDHLFFLCPFAVACWDFVGINWNGLDPISTRLVDAGGTYTGPCFMEVVACVAWNIWKVRNDLIFREKPATQRAWKVQFQSDILLHRHRVKDNLVAPLITWTRTLFT